ncbi:MAG: hypothetical protein KDB04_03850 [Acidimicrobiales bacterium]|nr:hypothetical protein [Acidimicrobiales bacterium]HRW38656.1 hypothetical protein [Aquihabitans sp.]
MRRSWTRRARTVGVVVALALVAAGCRQVEVVLYDQSSTPRLAQRYVTRDGSDIYLLSPGQGSLRISAPTSNRATPEGSQTRTVIWPPSTTMTHNQESCATWTDSKGAWVQQGLALRVRSDGSRFRAIVVAKNIWYGAEWQMNVYTWDTARTPYFRTHGAVSLRKPFADGDVPRPLPWRVCARAEGDLVTIKGWRIEEGEPAWDDPDHTGTVRLPSDWVFAGKAGWYGGHIQPGGTIGMAGMRTATWEVRTDG